MTTPRAALVAPIVLALTLVALAATARAADPDRKRKPALPPGTRIADKIVAIVNTEPVTLFELRRASAPNVARVLRESRGASEAELEKKLTAAVSETLDSLVNDLLITTQAREMDLTVTPDKIDAHLKKIMEANGWTEDDLREELVKLGFPSIVDYRRHTEREMLKSQVVGIKVASRVKVTEEAVEAELKKQAGTGQVEERRASHILIKLEELATPEVEAQARQALEAAKTSIEKGEATFGEMARRLSQDTNKNSGGDLGWFVRGDFDPEFEEVAFALQKGQVSAPFRTRFGMHIVMVDDTRMKSLGSASELEAMKRQIRFQLREQELERLYGQWVKSLRADAYVQVKDLGLSDPSALPPSPVDGGDDEGEDEAPEPETE